jgi:hypothetical protein
VKANLSTNSRSSSLIPAALTESIALTESELKGGWFTKAFFERDIIYFRDDVVLCNFNLSIFRYNLYLSRKATMIIYHFE